MKPISYWTDTAPAFVAKPHELPAKVDVAVVGGGFCGLSAALALARQGARVAVLEAGAHVAAEASGRNGGHVNNGLAVDYATLAAKVGAARAKGWYQAYDAAVDTVESLVRDEAIDCDFRRTGKRKLATKPQHLLELQRSVDLLHKDGVDADVELLDARQVRAEVQSEQFHGAILYRRSGQMHMGRFAHGMAVAAQRNGAQIHTSTEVRRMQRIGKTHVHRLETARGTVEAQQVLLATGASQHGGYGTFGWLRRRIVPIGSFILVTEPLGAVQAQALLAKGRNYTTVANIHHYFRLTADHRLVFGGRARFSVANTQSDALAGEVLRRNLLTTFPQLADVRLEYCWGGVVDMTQDRLPHAGERDGLYYSMGFSGHGTQMSTHMGGCMARVMQGQAAANPWRERDWPAIPGHFGKPWFLPAVGFYYALKDRLV